MGAPASVRPRAFQHLSVQLVYGNAVEHTGQNSQPIAPRWRFSSLALSNGAGLSHRGTRRETVTGLNQLLG